MKCECEHESHFGESYTPNGNPGHSYGARFSENFLRKVQTPYGQFTVCTDCANDCYHPDEIGLPS
jgi:hypothetical protein